MGREIEGEGRGLTGVQSRQQMVFATDQTSSGQPVTFLSPLRQLNPRRQNVAALQRSLVKPYLTRVGVTLVCHPLPLRGRGHCPANV